VAEAILRGFGAPVVKSEAFWSVSVQPLLFLSTAFVLLGAGVGPDPSKQFVVDPYPTRSRMLAPPGHDPVRAVVVLTRAILPAVADIAIVPVASGAGKFVVPPAPAAS